MMAVLPSLSIDRYHWNKPNQDNRCGEASLQIRLREQRLPLER
jgi:hypothetical protein